MKRLENFNPALTYVSGSTGYSLNSGMRRLTESLWLLPDEGEMEEGDREERLPAGGLIAELQSMVQFTCI